MTNAINMLSRPRRYFGLHYLLLRFLGLGWWHHPDEADTRNFRGWYFYYAFITELVWVAGFVGLESIDPFIGEKELDRFMFSLSFVITHDLTLIKLYIFFFKNQEIQDIVRTLEISLQEYYQNNEKNRRTIKITRILTASFLFFGWMTIANTNVYGIIQDIRWKNEVSLLNDSTTKPPRTLPQPIYIPWSYQTEKSYIFTFLLETIGLLWTGHIVMTIDTFIGSIILHMSAQFAILQEAFMTAYDRTIAKLYEGIRTKENTHNCFLDVQYDIENNNREHFVRKYRTEKEIEDALEVVLKDCFKQHQLLISCVEKFAKTYSYGFMTQLLSSMAAICVVMVQVSQDASSFKSIRLVISLAFFVAMIIQLAIQCFTGSELTYQGISHANSASVEILGIDISNNGQLRGHLEGKATLASKNLGVLSRARQYFTRAYLPFATLQGASRVSEAVMQCKWELMPPRLRVLLIMTIMRAQKPLRLTAAGFAYMDNACFLAILKAAYSYYAVLSQKQV